MHIENPVYLSDDKLTDQITVNMRVDGQEMWYPIVSWGAHWYESNNQWEVLMEDEMCIRDSLYTMQEKFF